MISETECLSIINLLKTMFESSNRTIFEHVKEGDDKIEENHRI